MAENIYFQWQNKYLRDTIYPVRNMKLRHFLLYYKEIDLWAEYQQKKAEDLLKEKAEYEAAQRQATTEAYLDEIAKREYFYNTDLDPALVGDHAEVVTLRKMLIRLHTGFKTSFDKFKEQYEKDESARDRKEKIFVAMRISEWEQYYKELKQTATRKRNLFNAMDEKSNPRVKDKKKKELDVFEETVLPRVEKELKELKRLVAAQNRLEKRKAEFDRRQKENIKREAELLSDLALPRKQIKDWEAEKKILTRKIAWLAERPGIQSVLHEITITPIEEKIKGQLAASKLPVDDKVANTILHTIRTTIEDEDNKFYEELKELVRPWVDLNNRGDSAWVRQSIRNHVVRFMQAQKKVKNVVAALESGLNSMQRGSDEWTHRQNVVNILDDGVMLDIIAEHAELLEKLEAAIDYQSRKDKQTLVTELEDARKKLQEISDNITEKLREWYPTEQELEEIGQALRVTRNVFLKEFALDPSTDLKKEIALFRAQQYSQKLERIKDHDELLCLVCDRFYKEPERFPLWLQYMVIHFSGMRYASAHGSWADPRDMLLSLRTLNLQERFKKRWTTAPDENDDDTDDDGLSDDLMQARCQAKIDYYEPLVTGTVGSRSMTSLTAFARAVVTKPAKDGMENPVKKRVQEYYIWRLNSPNPDTRRKAFLDLIVEEENYSIRAMKDQEVLDDLKEYKDKIPSWMWDEIVKLTDLRLTEVDSPDWEALSPKQQAERLSNKDREMGKFREIMNQWKQKNLTGWRQEHDRSNRLIVTRAVCNEVAEHIQHLRGLEGAAGLTQKPLWYTGEERKYYDAKERPAGQRPYFVRAKDVNDFEVGASILWTRFVHDSPNEWRIARPMKTREGDGLIDRKYLGRELESGGWVYKPDDEPITRTRVKIDTTKKGSRTGPRETQYLRWMHEATVATVADTAEGKVVLTFETALPYEDPSLSTIGVFKRYVKDLVHDQGEDAYNPAFVGFVPEGKLPVNDLEEMLDWNHIRLKDVLTPAKLAEYRRKYIRHRKPPKPTVQFTGTDVRDKPKPVQAYQGWENFLKWTDSLAKDNPKLYKIKTWGEVRDLSVEKVGTSNFQAVGLYNDATEFGAVSNFIYIHRDDIENLIQMQIDDPFVARRKDWLGQKMNWLCKYRGTIYFYDNRRDSWRHSDKIRWGTVGLGGNLVHVEEFVRIKVKGQKELVPMARLAGFRKEHWSEPLDDLLARGLVHRCFCAYFKGRAKFGDTPRGIVYSPFYSLLDWDFSGQNKPRSLYIPCDDLVRKHDSPAEFFDERPR